MSEALGLLTEMSDISITLLGGTVGCPTCRTRPAACTRGVGHQAVVTRENARRSSSGFGISESSAHAYSIAVADLLAEHAPDLLKILREHEPEISTYSTAPRRA